MADVFVRCGHCRGFYEEARGWCRYCGKEVPMRDGAGEVRQYVDRATCRAVQIAEFEQLPREAQEDPMRPDPEMLDRKCTCLHCPPDAEAFEAVEMRWMANEHMWACPCTTCGGRGFGFDIHLSEPLWQCAECEHWYAPANGIRYASNAKCPKCGSTMANGWFDDEPLTPEEEAEQQRDYEAYEAKRKEEEWLGLRPPLEEWKPSDVPLDDLPNEAPAIGEVEETGESGDGDVPESLKRMMESHPTEEQLRDDIDFPRDLPPPKGPPMGADDIPW